MNKIYKTLLVTFAVTSTAMYAYADTMPVTNTTSSSTQTYNSSKTVYDDSKDIEDAASYSKEPNKWDISVFGGANLSQWNNAEFTAPGAAGSTSAGLDSDAANHVGGVGGVKIGYDFVNLERQLGGDFYLTPRLEFEAFYNGFEYGSNFDGGSGSGVKSDIDSAVFSLNPLLKLTNGKWGFYAGPGIGATWLHTDGINSFSGASLSGQDDDLALTAQGLVGVSYDINDRWKIFTEYKYLHIFDADLGTGTGSLKFEDLGQQLVVAGIGYKF
jgi:opacity protein-like surface antigen